MTKCSIPRLHGVSTNLWLHKCKEVLLKKGCCHIYMHMTTFHESEAFEYYGD